MKSITDGHNLPNDKMTCWHK